MLVETNEGLVLVDTGLGLHDYFRPTMKVRFFQLDFGSHDDPDSAAVRQLQRLGYSPQDVQNIVMTHFQCADALPTNAEFDITPPFLNRLVLGPHVERLRAWSASHPEVRLLAGHMWKSTFTESHQAA